MSAVELMTIVGSKGLSADHVIIIGFDNVNMSWVTRNAFFVATTRARRSVHLMTALRLVEWRVRTRFWTIYLILISSFRGTRKVIGSECCSAAGTNY